MKVSQWFPTLCNPMDYIVHGILQARILEWVAFSFSRGFFQPRDGIQVSCVAGGFFISWATRETYTSDSLWSHGLKHARLLCPPLSPGVCANSCPWVGDAILRACTLSRFSRVRLCDPTDCRPPGSSVRGILQARTLEWVAISSSGAWTCVSASWEALMLF